MGKPYAGNLHVRFEEGGGVTAASTLPHSAFIFPCRIHKRDGVKCVLWSAMIGKVARCRIGTEGLNCGFSEERD